MTKTLETLKKDIAIFENAVETYCDECTHDCDPKTCTFAHKKLHTNRLEGLSDGTSKKVCNIFVNISVLFYIDHFESMLSEMKALQTRLQKSLQITPPPVYRRESDFPDIESRRSDKRYAQKQQYRKVKKARKVSASESKDATRRENKVKTPKDVLRKRTLERSRSRDYKHNAEFEDSQNDEIQQPAKISDDDEESWEAVYSRICKSYIHIPKNQPDLTNLKDLYDEHDRLYHDLLILEDVVDIFRETNIIDYSMLTGFRTNETYLKVFDALVNQTLMQFPDTIVQIYEEVLTKVCEFQNLINFF
jgi:hypothetical protein